MANKNARILWAVMTRDAGFDPGHVSEKPLAKKTAKEQLDAVLAPQAGCPG